MIKKIIKENYIYLIILIVLTIIFYVVKNTNLYTYVLNFDLRVIEFKTQFESEKLTHIMKWLTKIGSFYIPLVIIVCIFIISKKKTVPFFLTLSYITSSLITGITKYIINRPRPLTPLITPPDKYSFPSGHTLNSFAFYIIFAIVISSNKKYKPIAIILGTLIAIFVGCTRIYLGVHYFSDVIGGSLYGITCLLMFNNIFKTYKDKIFK